MSATHVLNDGIGFDENTEHFISEDEECDSSERFTGGDTRDEHLDCLAKFCVEGVHNSLHCYALDEVEKPCQD